jgi:hypothetical protein
MRKALVTEIGGPRALVVTIGYTTSTDRSAVNWQRIDAICRSHEQRMLTGPFAGTACMGGMRDPAP